MVAAVKQLINVQEDGRIEVNSPELRRGTVAEVIVLLAAESPQKSSDASIDALDALQKSVALDAVAADEWKRRVRDERDAWARPVE